MWQSEKIFGKYVMNKCTKENMKPIRIESASTISGMPDLYLFGKGSDYFIELKNDKEASIKNNKWKIKWRPGQQAWAADYKMYHTITVPKMYRKIKYSWTFLGVCDGVIAIRMDDYWQNATVYNFMGNVFVFTKEEFSRLNLSRFLLTHSRVIFPMTTPDTLVGNYINDLLDWYVHDIFGHHSFDVDMPSPDEIGLDKIIVDPIKLLNAKFTTIKDTQLCVQLTRHVAEEALGILQSYILNEYPLQDTVN